MRRLALAAVIGCLVAPSAAAQAVPGRDLLGFPVGALADPAVLATQLGDGLWNPAAIFLPDSARARVAAAALDTPSDQGVGVQLLGASVRLPGDVVAGFGVAHGSVRDIYRTATDPSTIGGEVPYSTTLYSLAVAHRENHLVIGVAARFRQGRLDDETRGALGADAGVLASDVLVPGLRVAVSTFLWRPAVAAQDEATYSAGADMRVYHRPNGDELRLGGSGSWRGNAEQEYYGYLGGRTRTWTLRGGVGRRYAFGHGATLYRLGVGLHYARYDVGVAREDNAGDPLGATYQFTLSTIFQ